MPLPHSLTTSENLRTTGRCFRKSSYGLVASQGPPQGMDA
jgi:hypothetical protein